MYFREVDTPPLGVTEVNVPPSTMRLPICAMARTAPWSTPGVQLTGLPATTTDWGNDTACAGRATTPPSPTAAAAIPDMTTLRMALPDSCNMPSPLDGAVVILVSENRF